MSRVGKSPITIPSGVTISVDAETITANGPKGSLTQFTMPDIRFKQEAGILTLSRTSDEPKIRANHGLLRSLVFNMVEGVSKGYERKLEINGVGYRVAMQGTDLKLNVGFSHDVIYKMPAGVNASIDQNVITISGISKQQVGQVASEIRALKKPEPYKGKGIRFQDERVIKKAGKSGKDK